jgi:hypothetical protein
MLIRRLVGPTRGCRQTFRKQVPSVLGATAGTSRMACATINSFIVADLLLHAY